MKMPQQKQTPIYANFVRTGELLYRLDTRIYLDDEFVPSRDDPNSKNNCVGAIIGKNPGSAKPAGIQYDQWGEIDLARDRMLPTVRNCFKEAFQMANVPIEENMHVRVWNMFYLCGVDYEASRSLALGMAKLPLCNSEPNKVDIVWFAWGGPDSPLNDLKERFLRRDIPYPFYYDKGTDRTVGEKPGLNDFAKHPQGMRKGPVIEYLSAIIKKIYG